MPKQTKSQAGLEYYTTIGISMIIVIIVGVLLFHLGVFSATTPKAITSPQEFLIKDFRVDKEGRIVMKLLSRTGDVNVTYVYFNGTISEPMDCYQYPGDQYCSTQPSYFLLNEGQEVTVYFCDTSNKYSFKAGHPYKIKVEIAYKKAVTGEVHTTYGYVSGQVEDLSEACPLPPTVGPVQPPGISP